jgi:hypothetical protein
MSDELPVGGFFLAILYYNFKFKNIGMKSSEN